MKLKIIGWPLDYSLSPCMHRAVFEKTRQHGLDGEYEAQPVKPEDLENWLATEAPELNGFNVTMPHKEAVYRWLKQYGGVDNSSPIVNLIGAVNTVKVGDDKKLKGYNTDGSSFLDSCSEGWNRKDWGRFHGKTAVLLGAGGAAQAIALYLAYGSQIGSITLWNRHAERAQNLAKKIEMLSAPCSSSVHVVTELEKLPITDADLLVNATPAGMKGYEDLPLNYNQLHQGQVVYDIVYEPRETTLIKKAQEQRCETITGDKMLAAQGAEAFDIWTDRWRDHLPIKIDDQSVREIMQKALDEHFRSR